MDDTIVCGIITDLTNTGIMDETPKAYNAAIADKVVHQDKEPTSKQSTTLNEATSREKGELDIVIIYFTTSGLAPFNYAHHIIVTRDQVQDMISQAMESFAERQRQENK